MDYKIKLYAHGVPSDGQQVWGSEKTESYIGNFYGRKSSVLTQLIAEVIPLNGSNCCYYTYFRGIDIIGRDGRAGSSYFALTLCFSHLYTDLVNLYNVLDASFNKFIVGSVLKQQESGNYTFIANDFNQHDTLFKDLEKEIIHYLMQFSSNSDFLPSNKLNKISNGRISQFNLFECNHQVAFNQIMSNGGVSISPNYPSVQFANALSQKDSEIDSIKQKSQNEIADIKEQCELKIQRVKQDKENGIKEVEARYANSASEISSLKTDLQKLKNNCQDLRDENEGLKKQIQLFKQLKADNERKNVEIERLNNLISKIKSHLAGLSEIARCLGVDMGLSNSENTKGKYESPKNSKNKRSKSDNGEGHKWNLKHIIIAVTSLFLLCVGVFLFKGCLSSSENSLASNTEVVIKDDKTNSVLDNSVKESPSNESEIQEKQYTITVSSLKNLYPDIRIDISGISSSVPMKYGSDNKYIVSLKRIDVDNLGGVWKSNDFSIDGNQITPRHKGACIIEYIINDTVLVSRSINVQ